MKQVTEIVTDFKEVNACLRDLEALLFSCSNNFLDVFDSIVQLPDIIHCFFTVKSQHQPAGTNQLVIAMQPSYILNQLIVAVRANNLNALLNVQSEILKIVKVS